MANPVSVPVFSGKSSLALSDLDAMADCVRDAQLKIGTLGGHTHRGHAQPGHAWYLPAPAAKEYGATSPRIAPGLVGGLKISREFTAPLIANGTIYLPMAQATAAAPGCTVSSVPGAIAGVQTNEQATAPFIEDGVLNMPPADGRLKGLRYLLGGRATWDQVRQSSGSEITVAGCWVTIDGKHAYVALHVGIDADGYLTFTLSSD
ncbi:MAG: hypothetical protein IJ943_09365 [Akkermansia sp.]|nr:hypothetical protein [Akkermansia sp.]